MQVTNFYLFPSPFFLGVLILHLVDGVFEAIIHLTKYHSHNSMLAPAMISTIISCKQARA